MKHAISAIFLFAMVLWTGCAEKAPVAPPPKPAVTTQPATAKASTSMQAFIPVTDANRMLVDFEMPSPPVKWVAEEDRLTLGASGPPNVRRVTERPLHGLWALAVPIRENGRLVYSFPQTIDLRTLDVLTVPVQQRGGASKLLAAITIADDEEHTFSGDFAAVGSTWRMLQLDLRGATGMDVSRIVSIAIEIRYADDATRATEIITDGWEARQAQRSYVGQRIGAPRSFYVQRNGLRLHVGQVGRFEITFVQCSGAERAWLEITQGDDRHMVVGQPHTGLMLLGQDQLDALGRSIRQTPMPATPEEPTLEPFASIPEHPWPGVISSYEWNLAWYSSVAALVEVKQTAGWADELGRPLATATWHFMIYSTGQIYVQAEWRSDSDESKLSPPVTIALGLNRSVTQTAPTGLQPLLRQLYANSERREFFPHEFQAGNPVAMLAKVNESEKDLYWRAEAGAYRYFGVGIPVADRKGPITCMLLTNLPSMLDQAAAFATYLSPAKIQAKMGQQDRTFPGDRDNDGLVEPYGFQVVRLSQDMAWFTLDPQNRPAYHPAILLSPGKPKPSDKLIVNLDGQQFTDLPRWPDGSFLLLIPYTLAKPVRIEARLVGGE